MSGGNDIPPYLSNTLAFLAGLCLKSFPDLITGRLSPKDFFTRIIKIAGLCIIGYLVWQDNKIEKKIFYYIFVVTLFCELVIHLLQKWGYRYISKWFDKNNNTFNNE